MRRVLLFLAGASLLAAAETAAPLERELERLAPLAGGALGACAVHLESGRRACVKGREAFPMASVFKLPVAVEILARVESGQLDLARMVEVTQADLHPGSGTLTYLFNQPGVSLSLRNLMELMLQISDNSAADILLGLAGGPGGVNARLRALGIEGIRVDRPTERLIADFRQDSGRFYKDPRDTATPEAMIALLEKIWTGKALRPEGTALLLDIMWRCQTGAARLKGILPAGVEVAHKTGTMGSSGNDVGIVTLPDGTHLAIAVFVRDSDKPEAERDRGIAEIARAAYDYFLFVR